MTALAEACADLTAWLEPAAALTHVPDTDPSEGHAAPASKPPWNAAIAHPLYDIHAGVRTLERQLRVVVTGTVMVRGGSDANTVAAIAAIAVLAEAADHAQDAAAVLVRLLTPVLQHPAIDLEEAPVRPRAPCPRCLRPMLRYWRRDEKLACLGCMISAQLLAGAVSGQPMLKWSDGEVTIAPEGTP